MNRRPTYRLRALIALGFCAVLLAACGTSGSGASTSGGGSKPVSRGAQVFENAGCSGCHTLAAAGATGVIGPNLNTLKPSYQAIVKQVTHGGGGMPSFKTLISHASIIAVAHYVYASTH